MNWHNIRHRGDMPRWLPVLGEEEEDARSQKVPWNVSEAGSTCERCKNEGEMDAYQEPLELPVGRLDTELDGGRPCC